MSIKLSLKFLFSILSIHYLNFAFADNLKASPSTRIVSLAPVITEIISELNKENALIGKTKFCELKNKDLKIPSIGGYLDISMEGIYSLKPDLVIMLPEQEDFVSKLSKLKIKSLVVSNRSVVEINDAILKIAAELGVSELGQKIVSEKQQQLVEVTNRCVDLKKPSIRALFIFDEEIGDRAKFYGAGHASFYGQIMETGNYKNVISLSKDYLELSYEGILALKPEVIFIVTENKNPDLVRDKLAKYAELNKQAIKILPKKPTLFPGPRYPEVYNSFLCNTKINP